jgi:hypothetical protein
VRLVPRKEGRVSPASRPGADKGMVRVFNVQDDAAVADGMSDTPGLECSSAEVPYAALQYNT